MGKLSTTARLVNRFWTPETVSTLLAHGLSKPLRCFLVFVLLWTTLGLFVSSVFFSASLTACVPFFLIGIFTGLVLPPFLTFKSQEFYLADLRGDELQTDMKE